MVKTPKTRNGVRKVGADPSALVVTLLRLAMTGLGVDKICRRAGHDMVQTTMGYYVKQTEDLTGDLGTPFGPLPATLITAAKRSTPPPERFGGVSAFSASRSNDSRALQRRARDSNPW